MADERNEVGGAPSTSEELDVLFKEWEQEEAKVDLSDLRPENSIVFVVFWALFAVVFLQLFARYVLNNSPAGPRKSHAIC